MEAPRTQYAKTEDGTHIAYQVIGDAPLDLVIVPGFVSHLEAALRFPAQVEFLERLSTFARLILFDKRGTGMSDPVPAAVPLDVRMDDLRAVMDAVRSDQAVFLGISEGGPLSIMFAATYPERARALVLYGSLARLIQDPPDYPWGPTRQGHEQFVAASEAIWGSTDMMHVTAPSATDDPVFMEDAATYMRQAASPRSAAELMRWWGQIDVRDVLPTIRVPTLVLHRSGDRMVPVELGRYLGAHIPEARYVELAGPDHLPVVGDMDALLDQIEEFVTGERSEREPDRVLATVLFTDIVGSTERATEVGDAEWRKVLDRHDEITARTVESHRGRVVKSTGDGILATFDGPARAVQCARALSERLAGAGIDVRSGLHTGEIEVRGDDVGGIAVHIASRVNGLADTGEVLVSRTVKDLVVGSDLEFADRGVHELKGVAEPWRLYAAVRL